MNRPLVNGGLRQREYPTNRVGWNATPAERIERYAREDANGCWIWTGSLDRRNGEEAYGQLSIGGRVYKAHRVSYEAFVGPIPEGMQIDHLCRVRACVNPMHLEPVTALVNNRRSPITNAATASCPRQHPYDEENTYERCGRRYCRTCMAAYRLLRRAMTPEECEARKSAGLPLVDLAAYFAERAAA